MTKDLFSRQSEAYARFRPSYPQDLYDYILQFVGEKNMAWDCATGNGQAALALAPFFSRVEATDISPEQIARAIPHENIHYQVCPADHTPFEDQIFDLVTIATAYHWLEPKSFEKEVRRVGKKNAVIAAWAYNLPSSGDKEIDRILHHFYYDIVYPYWDPERRQVENSYSNIFFPYGLLPTRDFHFHVSWSREDFSGYLDSWSSVQHYKDKEGRSPLSLIRFQLEEAWSPDEKKTFRFPLFLKLGRI